MTILLLPFQMDIFFPSCLIAVARTSDTMFNNSGDSGHLCLVPDVTEKAFNFSQLTMLAVGLLYMAFVMLRYIPFVPTWLRVFIINGYGILSDECVLLEARGLEDIA